jgi:hypothetical protein
MTIYYSPSTKGFYDSELGYNSLPEDVVEVAADEHLTILNALNNHNKEIKIIDDEIVLEDKVRTFTWNDIRSIRNRYLQNSDYTQMADWPGDKEAWATYRQALRDLPETCANAADVVWPTAPGE